MKEVFNKARMAVYKNWLVCKFSFLTMFYLAKDAVVHAEEDAELSKEEREAKYTKRVQLWSQYVACKELGKIINKCKKLGVY